MENIRNSFVKMIMNYLFLGSSDSIQMPTTLRVDGIWMGDSLSNCELLDFPRKELYMTTGSQRFH